LISSEEKRQPSAAGKKTGDLFNRFPEWIKPQEIVD
jgi:hypothetical protein